MSTTEKVMDRGFADLEEATVDDARARAILASTRAELGFVPPAVARMAASPALYDAFRAAAAAFEETSLGAVEREVVILVVAREVGCDVCIAMHSHIASRLGAKETVRQVLAGPGARIDDARLDALARFVEDALATHGDVRAPAWEAFLAAGFVRAQALEVLLGIGAYTMSTFANRMTGAHGLKRS